MAKHVTTTKTRCLLMLGTATLALTLNVTAQAQAVTDEIIVTARKQSESILDAPLSVTALQAADLESAGFENIIDIANISPGLDMESFSSVPGRQESTPFIRGIIVDANIPNPVARPVGVFIDGIFVTGGTQGIGIEDIARVEVIKGPQSATFGRSTFAGAINYITVDPGDEVRAKLSGKVLTRGEYEGVASIEGPIIDDLLKGKVTVRYGSKDGHYKNESVPGQRLGDEETFSIGGTLLFEPSDNWRTKLRGYYYELDDGSPAIDLIDSRSNNFGPFGDGDESIFSGVLPSRNPYGILGLNTGSLETGLFKAFAESDNTITYNDDILTHGYGLIADSFRASIDTQYDFENGLTLTAIAAYNAETSTALFDNDFSEDAAYSVLSPRKFKDYSAELRLSGNALDDKLFWSAGGNYYDAEYSNNYTFIFFTGAFTGNTAPPTSAGGFGAEAGSTRRNVKNYGISGQLGYDISDKLTVSLDGRYQVDELQQLENYVGSGEGLPANSGFEAPGSPVEFKAFLPRVTLDYKPSPDTLFYGTYSQGNLPGGFNGTFVTLTAAQQAEIKAKFPDASASFDEETLTNYELGWKQRLLDNRANISLSAFYMRRSDEVTANVVQVTNDLTGPNDPPEESITLNLNAQTTDVLGVEFEGNLSLSDGLDLSMTAAIIDSEVVDFPELAETVGDVRDVLGSTATSIGQKAPRFAKYSGSVTAQYTHPEDVNVFGMTGSWYTRGDVFYTGKRYLTLLNVGESPAATVVNLRTGIRTDTASLEIFVSNLTDEDAPTAANNQSDLSFNASGFSVEATSIGLRDRRQVGVRGSVEF